jgi:hypothetical protein
MNSILIHCRNLGAERARASFLGKRQALPIPKPRVPSQFASGGLQPRHERHLVQPASAATELQAAMFVHGHDHTSKWRVLWTCNRGKRCECRCGGTSGTPIPHRQGGALVGGNTENNRIQSVLFDMQHRTSHAVSWSASSVATIRASLKPIGSN